MMFVLAPWDKALLYGDDARTEMRAREAQLENFFRTTSVVLDRVVPGGPWHLEVRCCGYRVDTWLATVVYSRCAYLNLFISFRDFRGSLALLYKHHSRHLGRLHPLQVIILTPCSPVRNKPSDPCLAALQ